MKKKNFFPFCATAVLLLGTIAANAATSSWTSGSTTVVLTDDSVLTVSGTGAMEDYTAYTNVPWYSSSTAIKTVVINADVTSIGNDAFSGCSRLTSVTIPNSVTSIGISAFHNCSSLTSVTIPNSVTSIGDWAFYECSSLTSVTILSSVTSIGNYAFSGCSSLTSVTIPSSVTHIESFAFSGCSGLTSVTIPNSVISIGERAFSGCSDLTSVTIPESVTSIGNSAFSGCNGLDSVSVAWTSPPSISSDVFDFAPNSVQLIVPESAAATYAADSEWGKFYIAGTGELPIAASGSCGDNLTWELTLHHTLTISGTGAMADYSTFTTLPWYSYKAIIKTVVINEGVTSIGVAAFYDCKALTSVTIPESMRSIGSTAFSGCTGLTSVTIPTGVTSIGRNAFSNCSGLTSITIPDGVTSIGEGTFHGCSGLTSVTIPESVTSIGNYAFQNCGRLTSVTIPDSVTSIGEYAFWGCSGLTSVTIPNTVTSIANHAFMALKKLTIEDGTTALSVTNQHSSSTHYASFYSCPIDTLYLGRTITGGTVSEWDDLSIYTPPFGTALKQVTIGNSVTAISDYTFYSCSGLTGINIPSSVTSIGKHTFSGCTALKKLTIEDGTTVLSVVNYYYDFNNNHSESFYNSSIDTLYLGRSITYATKPSGSSYRDATTAPFGSALKQVTIGNSVTAISDNVFYGCSGLTSVTIGNSVISIELAAFSGCSGLTSVTIPNSVTSIGNSAFYGCSGLTSVTIPNNVTSIENGAFSYCSGLTSVTIPNSVTSIGSSVFSGCSGLTSVTIPNSVTSIGSSVFSGCSGLTSVTIPNSVTSIGNYAFSGCSGLTSVTIPNSVTSIGNYAFSGCSSLTSVTCLATTPPIMFSYTFGVSTDTLYVLANSLNSYKSGSWNSAFDTIFAGVVLDKSTDTLAVDGSVQLTATVAPGIANNNVTWSNRNTAVTTVSDNGLVTVVAGGTDTITVTTADGVFTATCVITVNIPVTDVTLKPSTTLAIDSTEQLTATFAPADATNKNVSWTSSDNDIATVDDAGLVTAVAAGTATITVTTEDGGKTATCVVTVIVPVTNVSLNNATASLSVGQTKQLTETIAPTDATNQQVAWASSDETVATVSNSGLVRAIKAGTATITVTTEDGGKTATCVVTVTGGGGGGNAINTTLQDKIAIYGIANGIAIATKEATLVSIFNIAGQKVYQSVVDGSAEIGLDKGVYVVRVGSESRKIIVK